MPSPPHDSRTPAASRGPAAPVWLPWLFAPVFLMLPLGGCGLAANLRRPPAAVAEAPPLPGPAAPATTIVTVVTPRR
jgi:hypothetical protein